MVFDLGIAQKTCKNCYTKAEETKSPLYRRFNKKKQPFCLFLALLDIDMFEKAGKRLDEICPYLSSHTIEEKEAKYELPEDPEDTHIRDAVLRKGCNWPAIYSRANNNDSSNDKSSSS
jgi:hypothetical protein